MHGRSYRLWGVGFDERVQQEALWSQTCVLVAWDARHHAEITEDVASAVDVVQDELLARLSQVAEPTF